VDGQITSRYAPLGNSAVITSKRVLGAGSSRDRQRYGPLPTLEREGITPMNLPVTLTNPSIGDTRRTELVSIQYLRALAALGVVLCHASISLLDKAQSLLPFGAGSAGVDLFFVISGFIMYYTTANRTMTTGEFYLKRLIRIFPLYFAVSSAAFFLARLAPSATRTFSPHLYDYVRSILFVPFYSTMSQGVDSLTPLMRPEVGQGWTLNYEVFFYFLFGLSLYLPRRYRMRAFVALFLLLTAIGALFHPSSAILSTYTDSLLLEFVLGVLIGHFLIRNLPRSVMTIGISMLTVGGIASVAIQMFATVSLPRVIAYGLPAACLVALALWLEHKHLVPKVWAFVLLGDASYSLYLLHGFVLAILRRVWARYSNVNLVSTHIVFVLVSTIAAEIVAVAVFTYAERPTTRILTTALRGLVSTRGGEKERVSQPEPVSA
jgi:exopolysaccharide production protein ExoZ